MSTSYTGTPTSTHAPAPAPDAGLPPILTLPADGDADNASSVAQAFEVLADYLAFEKAPFANGGTYPQEIKSFLDAGSRKRFQIDHFGLPRGAYYDWKENWTPGNSFNIPGNGTTAVGRWSVVAAAVSTTNSKVLSFDPGSTFGNPPYPAYIAGVSVPDGYRSLVIEVDGAATTNRTEVRLGDDSATVNFLAGSLISLEWDSATYASTFINWVLGFTTKTELVNSISDGVFFFLAAGSANWHCRSVHGGTTTDNDSGVAYNFGTSHHFRIILVGSAVDDGATSRALFFIDGTEVANITANLPIASPGLAMLPVFGGVMTGVAGASNPITTVGAVAYRQITATATV
jgi:hypothetical protein